MVKCAAYKCKSGCNPAKKSELHGVSTVRPSVFRFPSDNPELRKKWISNLKRDDSFNPDNCGVCERHFREEDFIDAAPANSKDKIRERKRLKFGAIPTVFEIILCKLSPQI